MKKKRFKRNKNNKKKHALYQDSVSKKNDHFALGSFMAYIMPFLTAIVSYLVFKYYWKTFVGVETLISILAFLLLSFIIVTCSYVFTMCFISRRITVPSIGLFSGKRLGIDYTDTWPWKYMLGAHGYWPYSMNSLVYLFAFLFVIMPLILFFTFLEFI